jgi:ADP-ribosylglycohydrolase
MGFPFGAPPLFDIEECSDNPYNDWIGAQIRADLYGWVTPGEPTEAASLARTDAALSHRGEGVHGAVVIAVAASLVGAGWGPVRAFEEAASYIPSDSASAGAIALGLSCAKDPDASQLHTEFEGMSPVHTVNNLALVTWGLTRNTDDFGAAIGDTVSAGWDTDCNGATVGGLWGLSGREIPTRWSLGWNGLVETSLSGHAVLHLNDLVDRTVALSG